MAPQHEKKNNARNLQNVHIAKDADAEASGKYMYSQPTLNQTIVMRPKECEMSRNFTCKSDGCYKTVHFERMQFLLI